MAYLQAHLVIFTVVFPQHVTVGVKAYAFAFADDLINELAITVSDHALNQQLVRGEIVLMSGVSERHLALDTDVAFHHQWHVCFKRSGVRLLAEMTYEPCPSDISVGITDIVTLDALMSHQP